LCRGLDPPLCSDKSLLDPSCWILNGIHGEGRRSHKGTTVNLYIYIYIYIFFFFLSVGSLSRIYEKNKKLFYCYSHKLFRQTLVHLEQITYLKRYQCAFQPYVNNNLYSQILSIQYEFNAKQNSIEVALIPHVRNI